MAEHLNVIFMGTPDFALPSLKALYESSHKVPLVVTQPDRPKGRGRSLMSPPIKQAALDFNLPISQPESIKSNAFIDTIDSIHPDLLIVIAFGQILPKKLLNTPRFGAINLHASLLPKYRGAAPIQRAIINGETETGVTIMQMDAGLDTGDILAIEKTAIYRHETAADLHDKLATIAAMLMLKVLDRIVAGDVTPQPQDDRLATYAPMLTKQDGHIDWTRPANEIENLVRGVTPWPGAYCYLEGKRYKIFKAHHMEERIQAKPGEVIRSFPDELRIATGNDGVLSILEIQGASGKRLTIQEFLRGTPVAAGSTFQ
jgi:methionyl-tRNA formyltransferase